MLKALRQHVWEANLLLHQAGLVTLTWGNVSGIDREKGLMVIKPSGVPYSELKPDNLAVVDLEGNVAEGTLNPSSDTPTHLVLYRAFERVGGISHTHSVNATAFAQACQEIPCLGTTHADQFNGPVPLARALSADEVEQAYETNTGSVIVERFAELDPLAYPGVLCAHHGPFSWGTDSTKAVENSIALEAMAEMALKTLMLNSAVETIPDHILVKHFSRKHGPDAYYGQKGRPHG